MMGCSVSLADYERLKIENTWLSEQVSRYGQAVDKCDKTHTEDIVKIGELLTKIDNLTEDNAKLRDQLKRMEWVGVGIEWANQEAHQICPSCGRYAFTGKHDDGCQLAKALRETEVKP
jgi:hypothetical protein